MALKLGTRLISNLPLGHNHVFEDRCWSFDITCLPLQLLQIALNLLHHGQGALQVVGQGFDQGVLAHAHGLVHVAQGKFNLDVVLVATQQKADGGLVIAALEQAVHGRQVKVELDAGMFADS